MKMRLAAIGCYVPETRISAEEVVLSRDEDYEYARVFSRLFGIEKIAVADSTTTTAYNFCRAIAKFRENPGPVDTLIYVHGFPLLQSPKCVLNELRSTCIAMRQVKEIYEVSDFNCAGGFRGLELAEKMLVSRTATRICLIAGDDLSVRPKHERYIPGSTIMGDAFVAMILDHEPGGVRVENVHVKCHAELGEGDFLSAERIRKLYGCHDSLVVCALTAAQYSWKPNEQILPHNVNRFVWTMFSRRHSLDVTSVRLSLLPDISHCCTTDPFLMVPELIQESGEKLREATLLSVGFLGQIGACKLRWSSPCEL